ncbi:signal transduction histidine kinase [Tolypothrix tenuis PCC 7101]|uniref:histidine kinase n=1 Tax=Tolypothrix tenuis PCC 7101 TaxID=231146 RepID=A0A1Z4N007_9CYAN|nr:PAS domain-containing protein [Aulosira sp. FACHB-113]BAY99062.1 signal transduction histidine kinase [Tolypothrix tenuis PCC 7101]BAZ77017.1 signal transduction histidine kinase [Aulosira laxa NIES-50]
MSLSNYAIIDSILTFAPDTPVEKIISYMEQIRENIGMEKGIFVTDSSLYTSHPQVKVSTAQSIPQNAHHRNLNLAVDCVYVVDKSHLLGIFTILNLLRLMTSGMNLATMKIAEVMQKPLITLEQDFDVNNILPLMQQYNIRNLPIVNDIGQLLGIITPESLAVGLQKELVKIRADLQLENVQHRSLEIALQNAEAESELRVNQATAELIKANKKLQREISDRIATEVQLLQTTSDLQEIFQAFPDVYFRIDRDGTILSYYAKNTSDLYVVPEFFLGRRVQDVFPPNVASKFMTAILNSQQNGAIFTIEYLLSIAGRDESFEARILPSTQQQIIAIIRNITERKQVQEALQTAKAELEIRVVERTKELQDINKRLVLEISERQRIEEALRYRVEFEKLTTAISTHFINLAPNEIENGINQALQLIGEITNVDRAYVFVFADSNTYEWFAASLAGQVHNLQDISNAVLSWGRDKLSNFETIHITNIDDVAIAVNTHTIQSLIMVPIVCSGLLIGYLEFDSVKAAKTWTEDSIIMLRMVGEIIGNALERLRVEQALRISEERYIRAISAGKVGIWEWNIKTNEIYIDPNLKTMLGYSEQEVPKYFDDWLKFVHHDDVESVKNAVYTYLAGLTLKYEIEHRMLKKDGSCIWFLSRGTLLRDPQENICFLAGSNTDITARTQAENKLKVSLKEKDILLKEIHHRVKNNLQIISSLLRLQSRYINDEQACELFQDSHNRVRAMAIIHENLYQSNNLSKINFSDYLRSLVNNLLRSYGIKINIKSHLKIDKIFLKIDTAISCGLIINELVSNSIKYAFPENQDGDIYIEMLQTTKNQYFLNISDNGVGISQDIEVYKNQSLGLQLVWSLVEQLQGTITFNASTGTSFTITFSEQR